MALVNHTHEELGGVILNDETNLLVSGYLSDEIAEFIQFNGGMLLLRVEYETSEDWLLYVERVHGEIVAELEEDGHGVSL